MLVRVKVRPRAGRNGVEGVVPSADGPRLRLAVAEAPENGQANRAACAVLARALGLAPTAVRVSGGAKSREKTLAAAGDPSVLAARLEGLG